jgi:hypothetical protein
MVELGHEEPNEVAGMLEVGRTIPLIGTAELDHEQTELARMLEAA